MPYVGLSDIIYQEFAKLKRTLDVQPINLGGILGSGGGNDGRPGGFLGRLPQTRITYDKSELAASGLATSPTLLDNLNRIRYRLGSLEGSAIQTIKASGIDIGPVTVLDYSGEFGIDILPSGEANIKINELDKVRHITFDVTPSGLGADIAGRVSWNPNEYTLDIITGVGPVLQIGQEIYLVIYNDTGTTISNLTVLRPKGATIVSGEVVPTVERARSDIYSKCEGTIMVATMEIPNGTIGLATRFGRARGGNTLGFTPGAGIYISPTMSGAFTETRPAFPNFDISIGGVIKSDASDGEIFVSVTRDIFDTTKNFWNGVFRESIDFRITSNGSTITGTLTPTNGHPDMTMIFSDGFSILDTSPGATITLTPGTDTNPQFQYIYVPISTKVLTLSTADWPTEEHIKVATCLLQTAATTQTNGALRNQNWNDHIQSTTSNMGHLAHIGEKLRRFEAQWYSGVEATVTIDTADTPDSVYVATTAGYVYQLHRQTFPARDMETGDDIHIVNDFTVPYKTLTDLSDQTTIADGTAIGNKYFSLVIWGVQNKTGEEQHLMCNLPTGTYNSGSTAVDDALNYSVYEIPNNFQGVGFLIARVTFYNSSGNWTLYDTEDLRGKIPNTTAGGGGGGGGGVSSWLALSDTPSSFASQATLVPSVNSGETALEFTSKLKLGGTEVTINDDGDDLDFRVESLNNANAIFVNAGSDKVGILTGSIYGNFTVEGSSYLKSNVAGSSLPLYLANYETAAAYQSVGMRFSLLDDGAGTTTYATILGYSETVGAGTEDGILLATVISAGANQEGFRVTKNAFVLNENGLDRDFRVESDNQTHMLFVDGGEDAVVIGGTVAKSTATLDIVSGETSLLLGGDNNLVGSRTDATIKYAKIGIAHYTNAEEPATMMTAQLGSTWSTVSFGGGVGTLNAATELRFYTAANNTTVTGTQRMTIKSSGNVGIGESSPDTILHIAGGFTFEELSADPGDPDEGNAVLWMSNGTDSGDDGDIIMKVTAGGVTKTVTILDFSEA